MVLANENEESLVVDGSRNGVAAWLGLVGWIVLCFATAAAGARFSPCDWFAQLHHPVFTPPNYVFGPVWSILYLSMGVSAWMVWRTGPLSNTWQPLAFFIVQLTLNAVWSWLFFGLHRIEWALIDIVLLLSVLTATIVSFHRKRRSASLLLMPYLVWVIFASALNFEYWRLNG